MAPRRTRGLSNRQAEQVQFEAAYLGISLDLPWKILRDETMASRGRRCDRGGVAWSWVPDVSVWPAIFAAGATWRLRKGTDRV
jgi:hypothetical protein